MTPQQKGIMQLYEMWAVKTVTRLTCEKQSGVRLRGRRTVPRDTNDLIVSYHKTLVRLCFSFEFQFIQELFVGSSLFTFSVRAHVH